MAMTGVRFRQQPIMVSRFRLLELSGTTSWASLVASQTEQPEFHSASQRQTSAGRRP